MATKDFTLLLVDDHMLFRNALSKLITSFHFKVKIFEASNGREAIEILKEESIDVMFLDVQMPVLNGFETLKEIRELNITTKIIVLTQFHEEAMISYILQLGAHGFLFKDCSPADLKCCLNSVLNHGYYYSDLVLKLIPKALSDEKGRLNLDMSERELEVLNLLKFGKSNKEISVILRLSIRTVESYRKSVMQKTKCRSSGELVSLIYRTGIV